MKKEFTIEYKGRQVVVEQDPHSRANEKGYIVHLVDGDLHIHVKEDTEGANRWMDSHSEQATPEAEEIGELIDLYVVQQHEQL
ncbi:hypothetical protein QTN47_15260 [Danxiaibacter flavus]|uniref:Uncharacterized protein n=1 Tax=Danxiaibacter flavus TaxID=3049108 RepID=A0ABV3ZH36_9BACT|nr:hypothetical protein QNM32_15270 [Chitinophagaceae bacterium DXS]